jgi:hypothetical protein
MSYQANCSFPDSTYSSSNKPQADTLKADIAELESKHNSHDADTSIHNTLATVYPVGSVYLSVVSTSPATLLGMGTWARIAEGQMLVGFKTSDDDFGTVEGTGGAKTYDVSHTHTGPSHTHTGPSHTHSITVDASASLDHTHTGPSHQHTGTTAGNSMESVMNTGDENAAVARNHSHSFTTDAGGTGNTGGMSANTTHAHTGSSGASGTGATGAEGTGATSSAGSATQSVINPFFVIYAWKRTA